MPAAPNSVQTAEKCVTTASGCTLRRRFNPIIATAVKNAANNANPVGTSWKPSLCGWTATATPATLKSTATHTPHVGFSAANGHDRIATQIGKVFVRVNTSVT